MKSSADATIDLARWRERLEVLRADYSAAAPFPHVQIDDFLQPIAASAAMRAFPSVQDAGWIHYVHVNERKHGLNKVELLPHEVRAVIDQLNSPEFVDFLVELTGIPGLLADDMLEGGGLHQTQRDGFLNVHADFTVHPHRRHWRRRVNLLVYLNEDWRPEYEGDLELWSPDMAGCVRRIAPAFNRAVIFNTDADSFHGVPLPLQCPPGTTRKSIALYYFTNEVEAPKPRSTNYRARPGQDNRMLIWLDRTALSTYTKIKRRFGIDDGFVSTWLNRRGKH